MSERETPFLSTVSNAPRCDHLSKAWPDAVAWKQMAYTLEDEFTRMRFEFQRLLSICSEGTRAGRPMDSIPRTDWQRAMHAAFHKEQQ
jgi:hypothetical protein